jgi:hypothetical protein
MAQTQRDGQSGDRARRFHAARLRLFQQKHNEANGEENRDGTNNNYSNNHGIEGLGGSWT